MDKTRLHAIIAMLIAETDFGAHDLTRPFNARERAVLAPPRPSDFGIPSEQWEAAKAYALYYSENYLVASGLTGTTHQKHTTRQMHSKQRRSISMCKWTEDEDGTWITDCNGMFVISEGTPMLNDMRFCCYCGKPLDQVDWEWPNDDA